MVLKLSAHVKASVTPKSPVSQVSFNAVAERISPLEQALNAPGSQIETGPRELLLN